MKDTKLILGLLLQGHLIYSSKLLTLHQVLHHIENRRASMAPRAPNFTSTSWAWAQHVAAARQSSAAQWVYTAAAYAAGSIDLGMFGVATGMSSFGTFSRNFVWSRMVNGVKVPAVGVDLVRPPHIDSLSSTTRKGNKNVHKKWDQVRRFAFPKPVFCNASAWSVNVT